MDDIIKSIFHALDMGKNRLEWYKVTGDEVLMVQCKEWNSIANSLINKLLENNNETCES